MHVCEWVGYLFLNCFTALLKRFFCGIKIDAILFAKNLIELRTFTHVLSRKRLGFAHLASIQI
jgi:hypothetical protein